MTDVEAELKALPEITRGGGNSAGPYSAAMKGLKAPVGKGDRKQYWSFFVPAPAKEGLEDPSEIEKDIRDKCRKLSNSFAGIARRIAKGDDSYKFAFRTVHQNEEDTTTPLGVRVFRVDS